MVNHNKGDQIMNDIDQMTGPELNASIETEIFGAVPLSDAEWEICKAVYCMCNGPSTLQMFTRLIRTPLKEPDYYTKLMFRLDWPRDYAGLYPEARERIISKMRDDGWLFSLDDTGNVEADKSRSARFFRKHFIFICEGIAFADTDSLAIARAALKAVREYKKAIENTR
jgi:hypothetical protein